MQINLNNFEALFYAFAFVIPGFILDTFLSTFMSNRETNVQKVLVRYFSLSVANYAVWALPVYLVSSTGFFANDSFRVAIVWGLLILVGPLGVGLIAAFLRERGTTGKALHRLGLFPMHPVPTSWDYVFRKTNQKWVIVTLREGLRVGGLFGAHSFASSENAERDLFLERVYRINDNNTWEKAPKDCGMWIKGDEIKYIEFFQD